jgi:hypothetical protein
MSAPTNPHVARECRRALLRFATAAFVGAVAVISLSGPMIEAALPAVRDVVDRVDDRFASVAIERVRAGEEDYIERRAAPMTHVLGDRVVLAAPAAVLSTRVSAGLLLQPLVFALALLCAWPWRRARELMLRAALAAPIVGLVLAADVPLQLCGLLHLREQQALDPEGFSVIAVAADLMNAGGRFALTAAAVALATRAARRLLDDAPAGRLPAASHVPEGPPRTPAPAGPQRLD